MSAIVERLNPLPEPYVVSLINGLEQERTIDLLLQLTRIDSEEIKAALVMFYTQKRSAKNVCLVFDIKEQNFKRAQDRLNEVFRIVCQLNGRC